MPARAVSGRPPSGLGAVPVMAVPDDDDAEPACRKHVHGLDFRFQDSRVFLIFDADPCSKVTS